MIPHPAHLAAAFAAIRTDANGTMWRLRSLVAMGHDCAPDRPRPPHPTRTGAPGRQRPDPHRHLWLRRLRRPTVGRLVGQDPTPADPGRAARCRLRAAPGQAP